MGVTEDPNDPGLRNVNEQNLQEKYLVLPEEERQKGFVRPLRRSYTHKPCGTSTRMGIELCETYARDPSFYGATYCVGCKDHYPLEEFVWDEDGERVGS